MRAMIPINVIQSALSPQQRAEGIRKADEFFQDYYVKLKAKHERQRQQAAAYNEMESEGEHNGTGSNPCTSE